VLGSRSFLLSREPLWLCSPLLSPLPVAGNPEGAAWGAGSCLRECLAWWRGIRLVSCLFRCVISVLILWPCSGLVMSVRTYIVVGCYFDLVLIRARLCWDLYCGTFIRLLLSCGYELSDVICDISALWLAKFYRAGLEPRFYMWWKWLLYPILGRAEPDSGILGSGRDSLVSELK
jgi:hypothetical protein